MIALVPNCTFLSETSRMLAIARALQDRGVDVVVASHGGFYESILDESGIPWRRLSPGMDDATAAGSLDRLVNMGLGGEPFLSADFMREAISAEVELLREADAEMVVIGFNLTTYVSSRVAGVPLATGHGGSWVPPVFERSLAPASVNPPVAALRLLPELLNRRLANYLPPRLSRPVDFINAMADEFGVERVPGMAALCCGDLTLVTDVPEILGIPREELEAWRPTSQHYRSATRLRYVGPLFARLDRPIPREVEEFLADPEPVVYLAPTSVTRDLLADMVRAVQAAGVRVLVAATIHDITELADARTCIAGVLPNHRIMPDVDLAIIMGGQGSVQCAMSSGVPIIGFPFHAEQELNLALAERQGMALRLSPRAASTPQLTRAVRKLLADVESRRNSERVQSLYEGIDGAANAAEAITTMTRSGVPPAPGARRAASR